MMLTDRFESKVKTSETKFYEFTPCLEWTACLNQDGYGLFWLNVRMMYAHRLSYEDKFGNIPKGLELDHLCRNKRCVNPEHLETVTHEENIHRGLAGIQQRLKTHCPQGHEYSKENTYIRPNGWRNCRICGRIKSNQYKQRKKMEFKI